MRERKEKMRFLRPRRLYLMLKPYLKMITKWDIVIMIFLVFVSFLPLVIFTISQKDVPKDAEVYALITVDNQEYKKITLSNHKGTETIRYEDEDGDYNIIEIKDETIRVTEASCRDQIDVLRGAISEPGETIICLPHKLAIEIKTAQPEDTEDEDTDIILPS